jgi:hypothetical protein
MFDWILDTEVLPMLLWQLAQYVLNRAAPSLAIGAGVGVTVDPDPASAVAIA